MIFRLVAAAAFCAFLIVGCSQTPSIWPTAPQSAAPSHIPTGLLYRDAGTAAGVLGTYRLRTDGATAELLPGRAGQATIGQLFNVDVSDALSGGFCRDCLEIEKFSAFGETVNIDFQLRHPLPLANDAAPVSAGNRRDLWLSSVKIIALVDGDTTFFDGAVTANAVQALGGDGFTGLLQIPAGYQATIFPYDCFAGTSTGNFDPILGWAEHLDDPTGYGIFPNNTTRSARISLDLERGDVLEIDLVLTASFSASVPGFEQRLAPTYFMPAGAAPEAWRVSASPTFLEQLDPADASSSIDVKLTAYDWQQDPALIVDPTFPNLANPKGLAVTSRISEVSIDVPGILNDPVILDISSATGTGAGSTPWTMTYTLFNEAEALPGTYYGLVKFLDERDPAVAGTFAGTTFIGADLATPYGPPTEIAAYAMFRVGVNLVGGCSGIGGGSIAGGSYPENTTVGLTSVTFDNEPAFQAAWDLFFSNAATRPPLPVIDFGLNDVHFFATGYQPTGGDIRTVFSIDLCANPTTEYLKIEGYRYETPTCEEPGASHPWCVTPIPKGAANWQIYLDFPSLNGCH